MKVRFYCDVWPGTDVSRYPLFATTSPSIKNDGTKRISFDVTIPDAWLFGVDVQSPEAIDAAMERGDS